MVSEVILKYIENKLLQGIIEEDVADNLKKAGMSSHAIQVAIKKAKERVPQKKEAPKISPSKQSTESKSNDSHDHEAKIIMLKKYISTSIEKKISKQTITHALINAGWKKEQIDAIFQEAEHELQNKSLQVLQQPMKSSVKPSAEQVKSMPPLQISPTAKLQMQDLSLQQKPQEMGITEQEKEIKNNKNMKILDEYTFKFMDMSLRVLCYRETAIPNVNYHLIIPVISETTDLILEEIRLKLIDQINLGTLELVEGNFEKLDKQVQDNLITLVGESFPHADIATQKFLVSYLISKVLGLGIVEIIKSDDNLEEIVINRSSEPVFVYHKKWGWCRTNQFLHDDEQITHLASMTGRKIGKEITNLMPLLDAHLPNGDRVNATIKPVTADGPTITIRKFSNDPWTITKFLKTKTMDYNIAALVWLAIQYELSALVVGGTASGKTSCLNVLTNLIPPDQRIVSIEDTREIRLPKYMHWVPMVSRSPNAEGKGGIEMEDLLINALRMRPDRIIVGEVRKRVQAETLFEAIHTGHSCYATFHANNAEEAMIRLTNPPVSVPKSMMPAVSLLIVQFRNRRSGLRRTFQLAEVTKEGDANVLYQYNPKNDTVMPANKSKNLFDTLELYTGNTQQEIHQMLDEKIKVLKYLVDQNLTSIEQVGKIMALYYTENEYLMKNLIAKNKLPGDINAKA